MKHSLNHTYRRSAVLLTALAALLVNAALSALLIHLLGARSAVLLALLQVAAAVAVAYLQSGRRSAAEKLLWTLAVAAAPAAGLLLYALWGRKHTGDGRSAASVEPPVHREVERRQSESCLRRLGERLPAWQRTANMLQKRGDLLYRDTSATWFSGGSAFFAHALDRLERAERFALLECAAPAEGRLWERLEQLLLERAGHGIELKLLLSGSAAASGETLEKLRTAGVEIAVLTSGGGEQTLLCVDGQYAYASGIPWTDGSAGLSRRSSEWRDGGVLLDGAGAWGLTRQWIRQWEELGGRLHNEHDYYRPVEERPGEGWCQPFGGRSTDGAGALAEQLSLQCIANAREYVWLTLPSLSVGDHVEDALCMAADGGVDVRLYLPGVWGSRCRQLAASARFDRLLAHGVQIDLFAPGFLHVRSLVCDGQVALVGGLGADCGGVQGGCGVLLYDMPAIGDLLSDMESIQRRSERVDRAQRRERSRLLRVAEKLLRVFSA